jgi:hypothetical protein
MGKAHSSKLYEQAANQNKNQTLTHRKFSVIDSSTPDNHQSAVIAAPRTFKMLTRVAFYLAPQLLLIIIGAYDNAVHAQGLVGAPVDPSFGQANEVGQMGDYGYDVARDCSRVATALSTIPFTWAGAKIAFGHKDGALFNPARYVFTGLGITFGGPTIIHLLATFAINNYGGLGGGL